MDFPVRRSKHWLTTSFLNNLCICRTKKTYRSTLPNPSLYSYTQSRRIVLYTVDWFQPCMLLPESRVLQRGQKNEANCVKMLRVLACLFTHYHVVWLFFLGLTLPNTLCVTYCNFTTRPTQPFILTGSINWVPACRLGWRRGGHLCRWQITLCDPIDKWRPVVLRWISRRTIRSFTSFYLYLNPVNLHFQQLVYVCHRPEAGLASSSWVRTI